MQTNLGEPHPTEPQSSWLDYPIVRSVLINREILLFALVLLLAIISRFYILGDRVMSHDETIHVYHNAWSLFTGEGYRHDPLSHGPFQTHIVALAYFLFGDSDLSARIPAVLFSIASVGFVWYYRRYLGKAGALAAAVMMLISPYMLYYGRYVRNEAFAAFCGLVTVWGILRYIETGKAFYSYAVIASMALHFTVKETSFIYAAQALLFLGLFFVYQISQKTWKNRGYRAPFWIALTCAIAALGGAVGYGLFGNKLAILTAKETVAPAVPGEAVSTPMVQGDSQIVLILGFIGLIAFVAAIVFLMRGYSLKALRQERSLSLLIILGSMVLPQLSAFPVRMVGWNVPTNATSVMGLNLTDIWHIAAFLVPMLVVSIVIGVWWDARLWLVNAAIFYAIFTVFYTTVFTNGPGFFTGMVGSLGYWLEQQGVKRGSQPGYYYLLVQIPVYEYLPALASLLGLGFLFTRKKPTSVPETVLPAGEATRSPAYTGEIEPPQPAETIPWEIHEEQQQPVEFLPWEQEAALDLDDDTTDGEIDVNATIPEVDQPVEPAPAIALLVFWVVSSLLAYTLAGEKMPWLTVHMTWPMVLFGGWAIGQLLDQVDWQLFRNARGWLFFLLLPLFVFSLYSTIGVFLGTNPPFQGKTLDQLENTSTFLTSFLFTIGSGIGLYQCVKTWPGQQFVKIVVVFMFSVMAVLTSHTAAQANYINYDNANELLVYAHSAGGVKEAMALIEDISVRTTDGLNIPIAFDGEYPFWWYLRNYKNMQYFGSTPTRSLREVPVIIVGQSNFSKIEPVVGQAYIKFEYNRLWWPNQDYFNLTWERIWNAVRDPQMREALLKIWLDRDYRLYGKVTNRDMSLQNWSPAERFRLYIRKDIVAQVWNFGAAAAASSVTADPYEGKGVKLTADKIIGSPGSQPGQFQRPRKLAVAPDGSLYVADTDNHRIQHLSVNGDVLHTWGSFGDVAQGSVSGGQFNQPWGIAVGPDGSVYVADTWNHRIQKFTAQGEFIAMWGYFGQAETPEGFWGPRDVVVDAKGQVFVTDTGNKRVVVFDADGKFITQFGELGMGAGQFDEPVGLAAAADGTIFVADTWNQRIQVFTSTSAGYVANNLWEIAGWYGQSLDNKPFLAVDAAGHVFASDPEGYRILEFTSQGEFIRYWGDFGSTADTFGLAGAVAVDSLGGVWVTDTANGRLMHFTLPGS